MKKNNMIDVVNNKKVAKIILTFILLQPLFDILNCLLGENLISIGLLTKGIILLIGILYMYFVVKDKKFILYTILLILYYALFMFNNYNKITFISETVYFIKCFYFPLILMFFCKVFDEEKGDVLKIVSFIISFSILLAICSGTSLMSYDSGSKLGYCGWFYSPNELSAMMAILFPIVTYYFLYKSSVFNIANFVIMFISMLLIGTKASYLAVAITLFCFFSLEILLFLFNKIKNKKYRKERLELLLLCILLITVTPFTASYKNTVKHVNNVIINDNFDKKDNEFSYNFENVVYYGREGYLKFVKKEYRESDMYTKIFGLGKNIKNVDDDLKYIQYNVERDFHDIYFCYGLIGTLLFFVYPIILIVNNFKKIFNRNFFNDRQKIAYCISIVLGLMIAFLCGHVLPYPAVSTYLALIVSCFINLLSTKYVEKKQ